MNLLSLATSFILLVSCVVAHGQMIVGHRGASYDAPENTVAAFRLAWEQGADGIEGDFYVTKDEQIACIHDADTERTGGKKLVVAGSTLAELRALEYGNWKDLRFKGEPIPTFAEVLAAVPPGKRFVIELKTGPEIVPYLKAELDRLRPDPQQLLIIAFKQPTVEACKKVLPHIKAHWLVSYKQDKKTGAWAPSLDDVVAGLRSTKADGLGTQGNREIVTPEFIAKLKENGLREFHVWTIDTPDDAQYFRKLGAMGITTNRPRFIRDALDQK
jgi:glycerophosphoryl diester phosphodiesterase